MVPSQSGGGGGMVGPSGVGRFCEQREEGVWGHTNGTVTVVHCNSMHTDAQPKTHAQPRGFALVNTHTHTLTPPLCTRHTGVMESRVARIFLAVSVIATDPPAAAVPPPFPPAPPIPLD